MHDSPAPSGRGGLRSISRREILKYALPAPALLILGTMAATLTAQTASAAEMRLIDFTERLVPADQIKSAGFDRALAELERLARAHLRSEDDVHDVN